MTSLATCLGNKDNNLNILRALSAAAVIASHAYLVTSGDEMEEPLSSTLGLTLGKLAVIVFFGISGLLISQSFTRQPKLGHFCLARILRLCPALTISLILAAFLIGPMATDLNLGEYFYARSTWTFTPINLTLAVRQNNLPGVYLKNPLSGIVNGSLWSLFYEVGCYGLVVICGSLGLLTRPRLFIALAAAIVAGHMLTVNWAPQGGAAYRLQIFGFFGFPFALGMAAYVWRDWIPLRLWLVALTWLLTLAFRNSSYLPTCLMVALVYTSFWLAFVPAGVIRKYNTVGDYSYGLYVYAFPIQQAVVHFVPDLEPASHLLIAFPVIAAIAVISWHFIEQPALSLAKRRPHRVDEVRLSND